MEYSFVNGNERQQGMWREAVDRLLNLPSSVFGLSIKVSFVDPSELSNSHTTLADTTWTYGSSSSTTKVRNTAPGFGELRESLVAEAKKSGLDYSAEKFYTETAVHELGHSLYANLPEASRVAIAQMFGAQGDELSELSPSGAAWQDEIIEGIAETFKEAFLPRRYRVFPNRTNKKIAYSDFAKFRRLFREGIEQMSGEGTPVPAYSLDVWKQRHLEGNLDLYTPEALGEQDFKFFFGKDLSGGGLYNYDLSEWGPIEANDNTLYQRYLATSATDTLLVPRGTNFKGSIALPQDTSYFAPSTDFAPAHGAHYGEAGYFGTFTSQELAANPEFNGPFGPFEDVSASERILGTVAVLMAFCYWKPSTGHWVAWDLKYGSIVGYAPLFFSKHPSFPTNCWIIVKRGQTFVYLESESWSIPVGTLSLDSNVPAGAPTVETCGGDMVKVRVFGEVVLKSSVSRQDSIAVIQSRLPSFTLHAPAGPCGGAPIELPSGLLVPSGSTNGSLPSLHPVG